MSPASRLALPLGTALLGFLAVVAAVQPRAPGRDFRRLELVDLIVLQDERVRDLRTEVRQLERDVEAMTEGTTSMSANVREVRRAADELAARTGVAPLEGPGVLVTLDDSEAGRSPTGDPNDLVVHERDIQTVVNALWAAGAEAVAINGERLSSVSAVRCAGNTLLLHGSVHSPPYEVAAIGDPERLQGSLPSQPGMDGLLQAAETFGIRVSVQAGPVRLPTVVAPAELGRAVPLS